MLIALFLFTLLGAILLSAFVILVFYTGLVNKSRNEAGHPKTKQSWAGFFTSLSFLLLIFGFFLLFDMVAFRDSRPSFWGIFGYNFLLLMLLVAFDSFFIDLWILGKIQPDFLKIPRDYNIESMKMHVKQTYTLGWVFMIPISVISTVLGLWLI